MSSMEQVFSASLSPIDTNLEKLPNRIAEEAAAREYERLRTKKLLRFPVLSGKAVAGALSLGGDTGEQLIGPDPGYVWAIRELNIEGLTSGTTPDVVNFYRNQQVGGKIFWQLNGNQFCQTFGRGQKILFSGDALLVVSVGTFAATGTISVSGLANQVAAERMGELF